MAVERTVSFWHCFISGPSLAEEWPAEDELLKALRGFGALEGAERTIDGVCYVVHPGENGLLLSMHKPIDRDFLAKVDWETGTLIEEGETAPTQGEDFANSAVVHFFPKYGALALTRVNNSAPRKKALITLLERCVPTQRGEHWDMRPVMDTTALDLFRHHATGVLRVQTRFSTLKQLGMEAKGVATYGDNLAENINAELDVDVTISLNAARACGRGAKERLKKAVEVDLPRILARKDNGTQVTALLDNGKTEVLDLVEQKLAVKEEIPDENASNDARLFSELVTIVKRVSGQWQDRVYEILEG